MLPIHKVSLVHRTQEQNYNAAEKPGRCFVHQSPVSSFQEGYLVLALVDSRRGAKLQADQVHHRLLMHESAELFGHWEGLSLPKSSEPKLEKGTDARSTEIEFDSILKPFY